MPVIMLGGDPRRVAPDGISGLSWWVKADAEVYEAAADAAEDGDVVWQWHDQSSNGWDLTSVSGSPIYKTNIKNGQPAVLFSDVAGTDSIAHLTDRALFGATGGTVFCVWLSTDTVASSPCAFYSAFVGAWTWWPAQQAAVGTRHDLQVHYSGSSTYNGPNFTYNNWCITSGYYDLTNIKTGANDI